MEVTDRVAISLPEFGRRIGVSGFTVRRAAEAGYLRTIYVMGRRLVPVTELQRVQAEGLGPGRKRWASKAS